MASSVLPTISSEASISVTRLLKATNMSSSMATRVAMRALMMTKSTELMSKTPPATDSMMRVHLFCLRLTSPKSLTVVRRLTPASAARPAARVASSAESMTTSFMSFMSWTTWPSVVA